MNKKMVEKDKTVYEINKLTNPREIERYTYNDKWIIRQEAITRLGEVGNYKSIKRLIKIIKTSKNKYDIIYANSSLGKLKAKSAIPELIKSISSRKTDIAQSAIYALGEIGDKSAIPYLEGKVKNLKIGAYCKTALKKLNKN